MKQPYRIAVLGGDQRQIAMVSELIAQSHSIDTWGLPKESLPQEAHPCQSWEDALEKSQVVILPLPVSQDGVRLFLPMDSDAVLRLDILLPFLRGKRVLGGRVPAHFLTACKQNHIPCVDYFDSEILQLKNALPTAEGALEIAMHHLPVVLDGVCAAVIGYGRIGELLAQKLNALGAEVTVFARRSESLAKATLAHCKGIRLTENRKHDFSALSKEVRIIFNTVPARLLDRSILELLPRNCILIELASAPGGFDMKAAEEFGMRAVLGSALPGKYAPESAGMILAQTIESILEEDSLFE